MSAHRAAPAWTRVVLRVLPGLAMSVAIALAAAPASRTQTVDAGDIAEGMSLYQQKGNCQACHGWAGDGRKMDNEMPAGANLREIKLNRLALAAIIKCGRPGTNMPAYDKLAYSDGRCFGMTQAQLKALPTRMPDPPATLQQREIDLIADFLLAKIVGKGPMDHARCVEYWGSDVEACRDFPK
jgi:cytochrome c553